MLPAGTGRLYGGNHVFLAPPERGVGQRASAVRTAGVCLRLRKPAASNRCPSEAPG